MSALPVCPFCGCEPDAFGDGRSVWCGGLTDGRANACPLRREDSYFSPDEWRRLAAPPLPETVRAVLRSAEELNANAFESYSCDRFQDTVDEWIAAGRPGLVPK